jgi:hypothetical protein
MEIYKSCVYKNEKKNAKAFIFFFATFFIGVLFGYCDSMS